MGGSSKRTRKPIWSIYGLFPCSGPNIKSLVACGAYFKRAKRLTQKKSVRNVFRAHHSSRNNPTQQVGTRFSRNAITKEPIASL
ncbi:bifunctional 3-phosphoadenosine 5-phosphosulfate synthase 2 [Sesbania bispinosa]|nr:bifunctional 3-phosphoadenosine 5-phosphosulfate synthase 2 [Sesbania bispinosa]